MHNFFVLIVSLGLAYPFK